MLKPPKELADLAKKQTESSLRFAELSLESEVTRLWREGVPQKQSAMGNGMVAECRAGEDRCAIGAILPALRAWSWVTSATLVSRIGQIRHPAGKSELLRRT